MRTLLIVLGLVVLVLGVLVATGVIQIWQTRQAVVQAPAFNVAGPSVSVGTENKVIAVPTVSVSKPGDNAAAAH